MGNTEKSEGLMQDLYCFVLDKNTGHITKYTIEDYRYKKHPVAAYKNEYIFAARLGRKSIHPLSVRENNLDKVMNDRMYTFNGDHQNAIDKFLAAIMQRRDDAYQHYDTLQILLERIHRVYVNNSEVAV